MYLPTEYFTLKIQLFLYTLFLQSLYLLTFQDKERKENRTENFNRDILTVQIKTI